MQDLYDTLRWNEAMAVAVDDASIVAGSGKENLGGGTKVGLTIKLLNAKVAFEARPSEPWVLCTLNGGNLVAVDANENDMDAREPTAYVTIDRTSSSSATIAESAGSGLTQEEHDKLISIPTAEQNSEATMSYTRP